MKYYYTFKVGKAEGNRELLDLLGNKGANLAEMATLRLPVPPGFTFTTEACRFFETNSPQTVEHFKEIAMPAIRHIEEESGRRFGSDIYPLLLSCRSGAKVSMPGMMATVLNIGLNLQAVNGLLLEKNDAHFVYDSFKIFLLMFTPTIPDVNIDGEESVALFERCMNTQLVNKDKELSNIDAQTFASVIMNFYEEFEMTTGSQFPEDPFLQLYYSFQYVMRSWKGKRAVDYRNITSLKHGSGTAVTIQMMVFGNMGEMSCSGVFFTRNPSNGENIPFGEYLPKAQGEVIVSGSATPLSFSSAEDGTSMNERMPLIYEDLVAMGVMLEEYFKDMQDIEFTIENGKIWLLQCRTGKRTAEAALKIAIDMTTEGMISRAEAFMRVKPEQIAKAATSSHMGEEKMQLLAKGLAASPGVASGQAVFTSQEAVACFAAGADCILVRPETSPNDVIGMNAARGILTSKGGTTSHAAVVARGLEKPCVVGAHELHIDLEQKCFYSESGDAVNKGTWITINGGSGEVFWGKMLPHELHTNPEYLIFSSWLKQHVDIELLGIASTLDEAEAAPRYGSKSGMLYRGFSKEATYGSDRLEMLFEGFDRWLSVNSDNSLVLELAPPEEALEAKIGNKSTLWWCQLASILNYVEKKSAFLAQPIDIALNASSALRFMDNGKKHTVLENTTKIRIGIVNNQPNLLFNDINCAVSLGFAFTLCLIKCVQDAGVKIHNLPTSNYMNWKRDAVLWLTQEGMQSIIDQKNISCCSKHVRYIACEYNQIGILLSLLAQRDTENTLTVGVID